MTTPNPTTMTINGEQWIRADAIRLAHEGDTLAELLGENVIVRTVTMIQTGRLVGLSDDMLVLEDAAWIADTGRWANALTTGEVNEVEPFPVGRVWVGRGAVVDLTRWGQDLPRTQK